MKLIGIMGKAYSGKSTAAKHLESKGFVRLAFSNEIKQLAIKHFGLSAADVFENKPPEVRDILQSVGMLIREIAPGHLLDAMSDNLEQYPDEDLVIDDIRMPDEAIYILGRGGKIVKVICPNSPHSLSRIQQAHETEVAVDLIPHDHLISAAFGDIERLKAEIERIAL